LPILGEVKRSTEAIDNAVSKLHLNSDRINAAIFWFYNGSHIDKFVFDALKESGDKVQQLIDKWNKRTTSDNVTAQNCSAYQNLSTYKLNFIYDNSGINLNNLELGIKLKLKFLESEFCLDFIKRATDITFNIPKTNLQHSFLNMLFSELEKNKVLSSFKFFEIISKIPFSAKKEFINNFLGDTIEQIETEVEGSKEKRNDNPELAIESGNYLFDQSKEPLEQLKSVLGPNNINYSSISEKVSNEILQCGIDYYNHFYESETDPGLAALDLGKKAKKMAVGDILQQRCQRNIDIFQEWVDEEPIRRKEGQILKELSAIREKLEELRSEEESIYNASYFIYECKPYLNKIKRKLGKQDNLYIKISNTVASRAQEIVISKVNEAIERGQRYTYTLDDLKTDIKAAWNAITSIGSLEMKTEQREHYETNKERLKEIYQEVIGVKVFIKNTPIPQWYFWVVGFLVILLIVYAIWGIEGVGSVVLIVGVIGFFIGIGYINAYSER